VVLDRACVSRVLDRLIRKLENQQKRTSSGEQGRLQSGQTHHSAWSLSAWVSHTMQASYSVSAIDIATSGGGTTAESDEPHRTMRHELVAVLGLPFADIRDTGVQLGLRWLKHCVPRQLSDAPQPTQQVWPRWPDELRHQWGPRNIQPDGWPHRRGYFWPHAWSHHFRLRRHFLQQAEVAWRPPSDLSDEWKAPEMVHNAMDGTIWNQDRTPAKE
jgi:hypothetical protein